jgi:hypothetical protein
VLLVRGLRGSSQAVVRAVPAVGTVVRVGDGNPHYGLVAVVAGHRCRVDSKPGLVAVPGQLHRSHERPVQRVGGAEPAVAQMR